MGKGFAGVTSNKPVFYTTVAQTCGSFLYMPCLQTIMYGLLYFSFCSPSTWSFLLHVFWPCNNSYLLLNTCSVSVLGSLLLHLSHINTCLFCSLCSKLLLGLKLSENCNCIADDSNDCNCIVFVIPDIPSWILKDDRKSRSLEPNIFKFNGVRLVFMIVIILMF